MKTPERPLQDYVAEVYECAEVRRGVPLPMGTSEAEGCVDGNNMKKAQPITTLFLDIGDDLPTNVSDQAPCQQAPTSSALERVEVDSFWLTLNMPVAPARARSAEQEAV
jgi:hypothetical protein